MRLQAPGASRQSVSSVNCPNKVIIGFGKMPMREWQNHSQKNMTSCLMQIANQRFRLQRHRETLGPRPGGGGGLHRQMVWYIHTLSNKNQPCNSNLCQVQGYPGHHQLWTQRRRPRPLRRPVVQQQLPRALQGDGLGRNSIH